MQPKTLILFVKNITLPFSKESEKGPTKGAKMTYDTVKKSLSNGFIQLGAKSSVNIAIAAIRSALSANDDKNCAKIIV